MEKVKTKTRNMVTRSIASGFVYNLYRIKEDGSMDLVKTNIILPTKRITNKILKNIMEEENVTGECSLVYIRANVERYEMPVEVFMEHATKVEE